MTIFVISKFVIARFHCSVLFGNGMLVQGYFSTYELACHKKTGNGM